MNDTVISTGSQVGDYDAAASAKDDEPIFTLQGGDPLAPGLVLLWAHHARKLARRLPFLTDKARERLLKKATSAEEVAWAMRDYLRNGGKPELKAEPQETYSGNERPQEAGWKTHVIAAERALAQAACELNDAAEFLPDDQAAAARARVEQIKAIGAEYRPKRASFGTDPQFPTE